ncbi:PD40 domain-containing protein, partial [Candidatus Parcubacteria bacterium]|nr:PD40 domain-containing protein [Candidatus Parcubacteria bacterium]
YIMERNGKQLVVINGRENKLYEEISNLTFSPDGKHFAYIAKESDKYFIVLDDKEGKKYSERLAPKSYPNYSSIDNLKFSPDSNFFAYTVNNEHYMRYIDKNDHSVLLRNLKSGKEKKYTGGFSFFFSPNSKYFLYKSYVGDGDDFGEKRNCNIVALNDNNSEFKTVKSYVTKKFIVSNGKYVGEKILNFNFKFSDDGRYITYNKEKIVPEDSFDIYYIEEPIEQR